LKVWTTVTTCELALRSNELAITRALKSAALAAVRDVFIPVLRVGANVAVQRRIAPRDTTCGVLFRAPDEQPAYRTEIAKKRSQLICRATD
jgi:hypothetical protein